MQAVILASPGFVRNPIVTVSPPACLHSLDRNRETTTGSLDAGAVLPIGWLPLTAALPLAVCSIHRLAGC